MKKINLALLLNIFFYFVQLCFCHAAEISSGRSKTITFYTYNEQIANEVDENGLISSYLGRDVRSVINLYPKTVDSHIISTEYMTKNFKDVIGQTNDNGTTLNSVHQYNPYGKEVDYTPSISEEALDTNNDLTILANPYGYSGYYTDAESGLCYLNARYYSPELMRFISKDSYKLLNRYAYADGNPIANIDPSGHMSETVARVIGIFAGLFTDAVSSPLYAVPLGAILSGFVSGFVQQVVTSAAVGSKIDFKEAANEGEYGTYINVALLLITAACIYKPTKAIRMKDIKVWSFSTRKDEYTPVSKYSSYKYNRLTKISDRSQGAKDQIHNKYYPGQFFFSEKDAKTIGTWRKNDEIAFQSFCNYCCDELPLLSEEHIADKTYYLKRYGIKFYIIPNNNLQVFEFQLNDSKIVTHLGHKIVPGTIKFEYGL